MKLQIIVAVSFAIIAILIPLAFLFPSARRTMTATGTIASKTFKPAGTYSQSHSGPRRGFQGPREIPIAESYVFEIQVEGMAEPARISLNALASRKFEVGQRVRIEYQWRGLPPFWTRVTVLDLKPAE